jgi:hypothetical protein
MISPFPLLKFTVSSIDTRPLPFSKDHSKTWFCDQWYSKKARKKKDGKETSFSVRQRKHVPWGVAAFSSEPENHGMKENMFVQPPFIGFLLS